jgi:hypothetical protein
MVGIGQAILGQQLADQNPEPPFHAVAHHGIADALGDGDAKTQPRTIVRPGEQDKARTCNAQSTVGSEEISTPCENSGLDYRAQADSFLRPRARRARRTLRPPTVAERWRKP